jgi:tryptophan-rich sensory protein
MMRVWIGLVVFLAVVFAAASFGAIFQPGTWYAGLTKPSWNPPSWVFGPVWTVLYVLIAVAAWLVWKDRGSIAAAAAPLTAWLVQLVLNALWSWLFFGMHRPGLALMDIALLWIAIVVTIVLFWGVRPVAGALLVPYLAWVSFATALNAALWRLNP